MTCEVLSAFFLDAGFLGIMLSRQPWLVQGILRTAEGVSAVPAEQVLGALSALLALCVVLFAARISCMVRLVRKGPDAHVDESRLAGPGQAAVATGK
jgi:cytochrome d ubiquinol oxidase subunit I